MEYRLFQPTYKIKSSGERRHSAKWHCEFRDHLRRRQTFAGSKRERDSHTVAQRLGELVRCRETGELLPSNTLRWVETLPDKARRRLLTLDLIDARTVTADTPLQFHLFGRIDGERPEPGYHQALAARGNTDAHVRLTTDRIKRILESCGFTYWKDLAKPSAATTIEVYLGERRAKREITGCTLNYYIRELRGFCRWLADTDRAPTAALASLKPVKNADVDSVARRSLSVEEMRRLTAATAGAPERYGLTGEERAMLYRFAFESGLRPGQIRTLTVADFNLLADPPTVTAQAKYVKRRRTHTQQLRPALAAALTSRFASKLPSAAALKMPAKSHMAEMIRKDLADARAAWIEEAANDPTEQERRQRSDFLAAVNQAREVAVFYSTRHGHGTALASAGVPERDIAASMHHASRKTTARYLHSDRDALAAAIATLPDVSYPARQLATGTHGGEPGDAGTGNLRKTSATVKRRMESGGETGPIVGCAAVAESPGDSGESDVAGEKSDVGRVPKWTKGTDCKSVPPPPDSPAKPATSRGDAENLRTSCASTASADADLTELVTAWAVLPSPLRVAIMALIRAER